LRREFNEGHRRIIHYSFNDNLKIRADKDRCSAAAETSVVQRFEMNDSVPPVIPNHVEEKYKVAGQIAPLAGKGVPLLPSCAHSYFFQLTRTWDTGSRAVRYRILKEFVNSNENATGPQLEKGIPN
jgi:Family of unknown function (DUF5578)